MAYVKQTWEDYPLETTPISSDRLSHMEDGIYNASIVVNDDTSSPISTYSSKHIDNMFIPRSDIKSAVVTRMDYADYLYYYDYNTSEPVEYVYDTSSGSAPMGWYTMTESLPDGVSVNQIPYAICLSDAKYVLQECYNSVAYNGGYDDDSLWWAMSPIYGTSEYIIVICCSTSSSSSEVIYKITSVDESTRKYSNKYFYGKDDNTCGFVYYNNDSKISQLIDDTKMSTDTTYSSSKILQLMKNSTQINDRSPSLSTTYSSMFIEQKNSYLQSQITTLSNKVEDMNPYEFINVNDVSSSYMSDMDFGIEISYYNSDTSSYIPYSFEQIPGAYIDAQLDYDTYHGKKPLAFRLYGDEYTLYELGTTQYTDEDLFSMYADMGTIGLIGYTSRFRTRAINEIVYIVGVIDDDVHHTYTIRYIAVEPNSRKSNMEVFDMSNYKPQAPVDFKFEKATAQEPKAFLYVELPTHTAEDLYTPCYQMTSAGSTITERYISGTYNDEPYYNKSFKPGVTESGLLPYGVGNAVPNVLGLTYNGEYTQIRLHEYTTPNSTFAGIYETVSDMQWLTVSDVIDSNYAFVVMYTYNSIDKGTIYVTMLNLQNRLASIYVPIIDLTWY